MKKFTSYKIVPELNLIIGNYQGNIGLKEVMLQTYSFTIDPDFNPEFNVLLDFRNSSAIAFRMDIDDYVRFLKKTLILKSKVMVGILYRTPNQEYLLKIYKGLGKFLNMEIGYFIQLEDCLNWMNFTETEKSFISKTLTNLKYQSTNLDLINS
jgi:hypothetical protein